MASRDFNSILDGKSTPATVRAFIHEYAREFWNHASVTYIEGVIKDNPDIVSFMITISKLFPKCNMIDGKGYRFEAKVISMILGIIQLTKEYCGTKDSCGQFTNKDVQRLFVFLDDSFTYMPIEHKKKICTCSEETLIYICRITLSWVMTCVNGGYSNHA